MYFDTRTSRALMDNRLEEAKKAARREPLTISIVNQMKERLGTWMIARGEKLVSQKPKIA